MSNKANNESFVDMRDWDFKARTHQVDLFNEDLDRTSATDFFNRTNGLGSPEFYQQKRIKELEEKENNIRGRMQTRRSHVNQKKPDSKKLTTLNAQNVNTRKKPIDNLTKQLSSIDIKPIAVPEREDVAKAKRESRSNSVTRGAVPVVKRESLNQRAPVVVPRRESAVRAPVAASVIKREPVNKRLPVISSRGSSVTREAAPAVKRDSLNQRAPVAAPLTKREPLSQRVPISRRESAIRAPVAAPRRESAIHAPVAAPVTKREPLNSRVPIAAPKRESLVRDREPIITRSKQREIQRFSFMRPTEASRRRSINPEKAIP